MPDMHVGGRRPLAWFGVFMRGLAMGIAEVVPGVSGGTIAFVSGIYDELVASLARFDAESVRLLFRAGPLAFWRDHNLGFLAVLGLGMGSAVLLFARVMAYWLQTVPALVWAFFFGLVVASIVHMAQGRERRQLMLLGLAGMVIGWLLTQMDPLAARDAWWLYLLGGMLAVSAWLLPAVSGSFLLLALGLYQGVLDALNDFDPVVLGSLAAGCAIGLLLFAKALAWLMAHAREPLLCLLTGFMAGALVRLWPWQDDGRLLSPAAFENLAGQDPMVWGAALAALAGALAIWLLNHLVTAPDA